MDLYPDKEAEAMVKHYPHYEQDYQFELKELEKIIQENREHPSFRIAELIMAEGWRWSRPIRSISDEEIDELLAIIKDKEISITIKNKIKEKMNV